MVRAYFRIQRKRQTCSTRVFYLGDRVDLILQNWQKLKAFVTVSRNRFSSCTRLLWYTKLSTISHFLIITLVLIYGQQWCCEKMFTIGKIKRFIKSFKICSKPAWLPWLIHCLLALKLPHQHFDKTLTRYTRYLRSLSCCNVQMQMRKQMHRQWSLQIICTYRENSYLGHVSDPFRKKKKY